MTVPFGLKQNKRKLADDTTERRATSFFLADEANVIRPSCIQRPIV